MIDRIKSIIEEEKLTPSLFADTIGVSRSSINHILNGRNNPSLDVFVKILNKYENINSDWLLFGTPPKYKKEKVFLQPSLFDDVVPVQKDKSQNPIRSQTTPVRKIEDTVPGTIKPSFPSVPASKKIERIMIFYSDNTFESFNPEK